MRVRPLRDQVLIEPDAPRTQTEAGLLVVEHRKPDMSGTVIACGPCPHPLRDEAQALADRLRVWARQLGPGWVEEHERLGDAAALLDAVTRRQPAVKIGERVIFGWDAGQELWVNEARYLMLREDELLAVLDPSVENASSPPAASTNKG